MKVVQNKQPEVHLVQISLDGASSEGGFNHVTSCSKKRSAIGRGNFRSKISTNFPRPFSIWTPLHAVGLWNLQQYSLDNWKLFMGWILP